MKLCSPSGYGVRTSSDEGRTAKVIQVLASIEESSAGVRMSMGYTASNVEVIDRRHLPKCHFKGVRPLFYP